MEVLMRVVQGPTGHNVEEVTRNPTNLQAIIHTDVNSYKQQTLTNSEANTCVCNA